MRSKIKRICLIIFVLSISYQSNGQPPKPEVGKRWILNKTYSDEFNGNQLNTLKWRDSFQGWKGRTPAYFSPESISVADGNLRIQAGTLDSPIGEYTMRGGAVQTLKDEASFGYYEARFKSSRIAMSTTFWMSNGKVPVNAVTKKSGGVDCSRDRFSQELDIAETIGGVFEGSDKFRTQMNFNTHYRYIDCNGGREKFFSVGNNAVEGSGTKANAQLPTETWESFNVYACYWKNANQAEFYLNNKVIGTANISTEVVDKPFPRPMKVNLVVETYNWATPHPSVEQLNDAKINTALYDWVRSYILIDIDEDYSSTSGSETPIIWGNEIIIDETKIKSGNPTITIDSKSDFDRKIKLTIEGTNNKNIHSQVIPSKAGHGVRAIEVELNLKEKQDLNIKVELQSLDEKETFKTDSKTVSFDGSDTSENPGVSIISSIETDRSDKTNSWSFYPNPSYGFIQFDGLKSVTTIEIYDLVGSLAMKKMINPKDKINVSSLEKGVYLIRAGGFQHKLILK